MKIYFCDLCNESIRQEDLEKSRVTTARGKMICAKCLPAESAAGSVPTGGATPIRAGGSSLGLALGLAGAVLGGAALWQALEAKDRMTSRPDPAPKLGELMLGSALELARELGPEK